MAITINDKVYDETKLDAKLRNSIVQVNNHQNKLNSLVADVENVKLVLDHHRKYLTDNLPAEAEVEAPAETEAPKA
jgi:hypothetical protein|tara:strand:+ start:1022 stop:1249 length:228 start_codon:yes stop_codon:yes gene_type:complete